ncbi:PBECR2 nuclease fold domain-containing protein, partial [Helicobacter sp. 11S02629-2]|uniref:PBECR2 nuclease fold domain-containing protein n=1 Tax=Helicobacter sp. 11S02629-2 TaxID=1476195 RepID=UPI0015DB1DC0
LSLEVSKKGQKDIYESLDSLGLSTKNNDLFRTKIQSLEDFIKSINEEDLLKKKTKGFDVDKISKEAKEEARELDSENVRQYKPYTFTYKKVGANEGKEVTADANTVKEWMESLGLKNLEDEFVPKVPRVVQEYLGGDIKLTLGSFRKLVANNRTSKINEIRPTLEAPDIVLRDKDDAIIFAKILDDKLYFTSVVKNYEGEYIVSSNWIKTANTINNLEKDGEVVYQSPKLLDSRKAFTDITSSTNKTDIQQNATTTPKISQEVVKKEEP